MPVAETIVAIAAVYVSIGLLFAAAFVTTGVGRIDPSAAHAPIGFRIVILPGTVAFWPLLALRWIRGQQPPVERTPHKAANLRRMPASPQPEARS